MRSRVVERSLVLLSLQRALLGEVFTALRAVTVEWSGSLVKFWAYVDGPLSEEDAESLSCVSAEVAADFWDGIDIAYEVVRLAPATRVEDQRVYVFLRRD
jgi:hypothetical protein